MVAGQRLGKSEARNALSPAAPDLQARSNKDRDFEREDKA